MLFTVPTLAESSNHYEGKPVKELPESELIVPEITKISEDPNYLNVLPYGAGEWDFIGHSYFRLESKMFYSGGGDLMIAIAIPFSGGARWLFKLYEEDPVWHSAVSSFQLPNAKGVYSIEFDVSSLPDGNNNKAELHLSKLTYPTTAVDTSWYD
ncbi:hypothetical protein [Gracilibacillus phocaeensis]|uniref:hypothetical protein n=1 Tax=Gracilibacillus phocaeensis TaxID=2042304 RepID=UPI0013EF33DE|nr:hypothetical protein [Gracilibacillus phocaeensis]